MHNEQKLTFTQPKILGLEAVSRWYIDIVAMPLKCVFCCIEFPGADTIRKKLLCLVITEENKLRREFDPIAEYPWIKISLNRQ
jgi:hypothetical protein